MARYGRLSISTLAALTLAAQFAAAADSVSVSFRYSDASGTVVRAFVPGEFNNWGPQIGGVISAGAPSEMTYLPSGGYWRKSVRLEIGRGYAYKFYLHLDPSGSTYQWIADPLNPLTDGSQYGNSLLNVTPLMIVEPEAKRDSTGSTRSIIAGIPSIAGVTLVQLLAGADSLDITSSYDTATGIVTYTLPVPISQEKAVTLVAHDVAARTATHTFPGFTPSNRKLDVTFLFHANQNLVPYAKVGDRASFRGLLQTLRKHSTLKFQLHFSGPLIHDLLWFGDSTLHLVRDGINAGQFEIFGSAYAQNVMYSTRLDTSDIQFNQHQIAINRTLIEKALGVSPKAFWNPERVWTQNFVQLLADNGYDYVPVEDHILTESGATGPIYQVRTTAYNGKHVTVFEDDKEFLALAGNAINTGAVGPVMTFLHAKHAEDTSDTYVIGYYEDAEATGLWGYQNGIDPQTAFNNLDALLTALEGDSLIAVTTYGNYLKSHAPSAELTPIRDGAAAWMGGNAWFTENMDPAFQSMRAIYDSLRLYLDSVALAIRQSGADTTAASALLRHAWFTLCAHQFEFGCHTLQADVGHAQLQLARTSAVSATAALYALAPASSAFVADVNRDGVNEIVLVTPKDFTVFSSFGGRMLYWFDLVRGEELVGNENFMVDYVEPYVNDNIAPPLTRGGIETYPWLAGNPVIPEVFGWTFWVRQRALNDVLTVGSGAPRELANEQYAAAINGTTVTFTITVDGIRIRKTIQPETGGRFRVSYSMSPSPAANLALTLRIRNSFSPSYLDVMDNGRTALTYVDGSGTLFSQSVTPSTRGVRNSVTGSVVMVDWVNAPDQLDGTDNVFGLELNPSYAASLTAGDSTAIEFVYWNRESVSSIDPPAGAIPRRFALAQNYPNPFNPSTTIVFEIPSVSWVKLIVYDLLGREVARLVDETRQAGQYSVRFNAGNLGTGAYFCRLTAGSSVAIRKLLVVK
jgi:hypothetical protein